MSDSNDSSEVMSADVVLVGAGIMSTTLAVFLKELQPHLRVEIIEEDKGKCSRMLGTKATFNRTAGRTKVEGPDLFATEAASMPECPAGLKR